MRIKPGQTPLEQMAIDANLERVGLKKTAVGTVEGDGPPIGLEELSAKKTKRPWFSLGGDGSVEARAQITSAAGLIRAAGTEAGSLVDRLAAGEEMDVLRELSRTGTRLKLAGEALEQAIDKKVLAHAGPEQVRTLSEAYQDFLTGWAAFGQAVAKVHQNFPAVELNHLTAAAALTTAHRLAEGVKVETKTLSGQMGAELAELAARLLRHAPVFEVGHSHVTTRSKPQPHDALAAEIQRWAFDAGFTGGAYMLTLSQMQQYAAQHGLPVDQVAGAVKAISEGRDVLGRVRTWAAEAEKPVSRFFFTLSEMDQVGADIGASTKDVMAALDLADAIHQRNQKVKG